MENIANQPQVVGAYYAKTHFSELLDGLEKGKTYLVTRNDLPVGKLIPYDQDELEEKKRLARLAYEQIIETRKGVTLGDNLTIKDLINEGRKYL